MVFPAFLFRERKRSTKDLVFLWLLNTRALREDLLEAESNPLLEKCSEGLVQQHALWAAATSAATGSAGVHGGGFVPRPPTQSGDLCSAPGLFHDAISPWKTPRAQLCSIDQLLC